MYIMTSDKLKYFFYISEAKVNMLYGQLKGESAQRKTEWGVDLKLASVKSSTEQNYGSVSRERRLEEVVNVLRRDNQIGSIDEPKESISVEPS